MRPESNQLYDHIIVDMPATGHALALTQLPEILLHSSPGPIAEALCRGKAIINDPEQDLGCQFATEADSKRVDGIN